MENKLLNTQLIKRKAEIEILYTQFCSCVPSPLRLHDHTYPVADPGVYIWAFIIDPIIWQFFEPLPPFPHELEKF